jgi:hypothetical protein
MPNQVTNNIRVEGNESCRAFFSKICDRLNQKSSDKITQLPALLWKNTYKGTIKWNYRNMKCRWAVMENFGENHMCVLSGRSPADGVHNRIFKTLRKMDENVVLVNDYSDSETECIGTRILYRNYEANETVSEEDLTTLKQKENSDYFHELTDMMKAVKYQAEGKLYEWKNIHQGEDDDQI